jgi:hypothetical protein
LFFVGDAMSTTNPAAGRGVSLGLLQAAALVTLLDHEHHDYRGVARQFDAWSIEHIRPWFEDQVYRDATLLARFLGEDIDLDARIPSDIICAAADVDPTLRSLVGPYLAMQAQPESLLAVEDRVRHVLRGGWRPRLAEGPSRQELVQLIHSQVLEPGGDTWPRAAVGSVERDAPTEIVPGQ